LRGVSRSTALLPRVAGLFDARRLGTACDDGADDSSTGWPRCFCPIDITSAPDDDEWCSIDREVDENFNTPRPTRSRTRTSRSTHVENTTPSDTLQFTPLAGATCGIARAARP
jgi:hypothetical protein